MGYHNHEENIKRARDLIEHVKKECQYILHEGRVSALLESFIEDAEIGHRRIEQLEKKLAEKPELGFYDHLEKTLKENEELKDNNKNLINIVGELRRMIPQQPSHNQDLKKRVEMLEAENCALERRLGEIGEIILKAL